ncbi:MAG: hypothetical protein E6Q66_09980 [Pedobacter sp.]|jgi:hypothetical protein|nr:MAG: hypothetical protein E6Q66_09980 [Pedobacter sp.]
MIIQSLQKLIDTGEQPYAKVCMVHRVDKANKCCDVIPVDGSAELFDVPFHPSEGDAGLCLYPALGSHVLVVFINKHHACICQVSEVELMKLKVDQIEFSVDKEGFLLKKENETLKKLVDDLLKAILEIKILTPSGTGTLDITSQPTFKTLQTRFNNLLKDE